MAIPYKDLYSPIFPSYLVINLHVFKVISLHDSLNRFLFTNDDLNSSQIGTCV